MNLRIASDVHGSAYFGRKLPETDDREGAKRMLLHGRIRVSAIRQKN